MTFELVLDVVIGLTLIYALFSLVNSATLEFWASLANRRGNMLQYGLLRIFDNFQHASIGSFDPTRLARLDKTGIGKYSNADSNGLANTISTHPLVARQNAWKRFPSYLSGATIADVLFDVLSKELPPNSFNDEGLLRNIRLVKNRKDAIGAAADFIIMLAPEDDLSVKEIRARIIKYYEDSMERITGWYKRRTQYTLFATGLLIAISMNVNSIYIAQQLADNANLRDELVNRAEEIVDDPSKSALASAASPTGDTPLGSTTNQQTRDNAIKEIEALGLPIGWRHCVPQKAMESDSQTNQFDFNVGKTSEIVKPNDATACPYQLASPFSGNFAILFDVQSWFGWLLTAAALSLGAPFWFDAMSRLVRLRASGAVPGTQDKENAKNQAPTSFTIEDKRKDGDAPGGGQTPIPPPLPPTTPFESQNLARDDIRDIQEKLEIEITGVLSAQTRAAIREYRIANGYGDGTEITEKLARELIGKS